MKELKMKEDTMKRFGIKKLPSKDRAWEKYYDPEIKSITLPQCSLYDFMKKNNQNKLNEPALYYYGKRFSYGELINKILKYTRCFLALGVKEGDYITIVSVNLPETIFSFYALNRIGAIPVLVEPRMSKERIQSFIEMVDSKTILVLDNALHKVNGLIDKLGLKHIIVQSFNDSLPDELKKGRQNFSNNNDIQFTDVVIDIKTFESLNYQEEILDKKYVKDSICLISQTGGTTGIPKGVKLTDDGINSVVFNAFFSFPGLRKNQKFLDIMPIFTSYGVVCGIHLPLCLGFELILVPDFAPDMFPALVKKYEPNYIVAVPVFYESLYSEYKDTNLDLSSLVMAISGGDIMNVKLEQNLNEFLKIHGAKYPIAQGYGLSETSAAVAFTFGNVYSYASVGVPLYTSTVGIFKPGTDIELGYGEVGEICISGPSIMAGYFNNEEETAKVRKLHSDEKIWIHSGDLGSMNEEGFLLFKGRLKYVIPRFDGHKNYPVQIERIVMKNKNIANCTVVGVKDREHSQGMYPLIIVELNDSKYDKEKIRTEILGLCDEMLEERGKPCDVIIIDKIPLTKIGKNDIALLSEQYQDYDYRKTDNN